MTVHNDVDRSGPYAGAGTTGPFAVSFDFADDSHLKVIKTTAAGVETILALNTDYTVVGAGDAGGGAVTTIAVVASGETITIDSDVPFTQLRDYTHADDFPSEMHEGGLDHLTRLAQQLRRLVRRSLRVPEFGVDLPLFPSAADRANHIMAFDSLGNPSVLIPTGGTAADVMIDLANTADPSKGDALVGVKRSDTGALALTLHDWIEKLPFRNALSEFGTIQQALDACNAAGGGVVVLPVKATPYALGANSLTLYQNTALVGETDAYVAGTRGTRLSYSGSGNAILGENLLNVRLENFQLDCSAATGSTVKGIYLKGCWRSSLRHVTVKGVSPAKGDGIYIDTFAASWGGQHNVLDNCECSDGRIRLVGTGGSDGVTTTELRTIRGLQYQFFHSNVICTNVTAEVGPYNPLTNYVPGNCVTNGGIAYECILPTIGQAPPNATFWVALVLQSGYACTGSGAHVTFSGCDCEGTWPIGVHITSDAKVFGVGTMNWNGFAGATRVSGDVQPLTMHGGPFELTAALAVAVEREILRVGDANVSDYVSLHIYPQAIGGGAQDGFAILKRRIAGAEVITHELLDEFRLGHSKSIANSATNVLTLPIPANTALRIEAFAWGNDGGGAAFGVSQLAVAKNDSAAVSVSVQAAVKEAAAYAGAFTFTPSGSNIVVQFATAHATPTIVFFKFDIAGPSVGYTKG